MPYTLPDVPSLGTNSSSRDGPRMVVSVDGTVQGVGKENYRFTLNQHSPTPPRVGTRKFECTGLFHVVKVSW